MSGKSDRSPGSTPRFLPLHRHPLIWLSAALWAASFFLLLAVAVAAVVTAIARAL
jgi:hypothetical protein